MLELQTVSKSFGEKPIFENLSAAFPPGIHAITGPSGAGKTTLLRIIAGLEPYTGTVCGAGKVSYCFQEPRLLPRRTALQNVALVSETDTAAEMLCALGLENDLHTYPEALSGGMQCRVSLARALAAPYDTLLLDEPFSGLDADTAQVALQLIRTRAKGKTVLLVTHDDALASTLDSNFIIEKKA